MHYSNSRSGAVHLKEGVGAAPEGEQPYRPYPGVLHLYGNRYSFYLNPYCFSGKETCDRTVRRDLSDPCDCFLCACSSNTSA